MSACLKAALVQMQVQPETKDSLARAGSFIKKAAAEGADLVLLPEMFCCPYQTKNFPLYAQQEGEEVWQELSRMAREQKVILAAGSVPERDEAGKIYNTAYVFDREGRQIAKHRKMHLFDIDVSGGQSFRESDTLTPGNSVTTFETEFGVMGLCICYDFRFPELSRLMVDRGAQVILVPAAFNMTTGPAHWEILFRTRALDNQVFTLGAAPSRDPSSGYTSYGNSIAVSPWGDVMDRLEEQEGMLLCTLDLDRVAQVRRELPLLAHRRKDVYTLTENR
ncbi:carbon-nitrogen hydrolase family protein [Angelakisella massiliensis]|uniref:carbon-nitrogen hydrolase family protein n=1 Tax=Angelakisella massiliensis TaxID=1871018 RepID=UPI0023A79290|nr:carbon-nitrogen hydrolase family protein [Angelakisella massiliensis]